MFFYEIHEIFKNTLFHRTPLVAASEAVKWHWNILQTYLDSQRSGASVEIRTWNIILGREHLSTTKCIKEKQQTKKDN